MLVEVLAPLGGGISFRTNIGRTSTKSATATVVITSHEILTPRRVDGSWDIDL